MTPSGQSEWIWHGAPASTAALQRVTGGRVAGTWYAATGFAIDVDLPPGAPQRVALYLLDWDGGHRSQRVDVVDGVTGARLDSRTASGFSSGQYLVWRVEGHVRFVVTRISGPNAVVSGVFLSAWSADVPPVVSLSAPAPGASFTAPAEIALTAQASDDGAIAGVAFYANDALIGTDSTRPYVATWSGVAAGTYQLTAVATDDGGQVATSAPVTVHVSHPAGVGARATFLGVDETTRGDWRSRYGVDGHAIVGDAIAYPAYATVQAAGHASWTWRASPSEARALHRVATGRVAATWYSGSAFSLDVHLTDHAFHRVALYLLDWDGGQRALRIDVGTSRRGWCWTAGPRRISPAASTWSGRCADTCGSTSCARAASMRWSAASSSIRRRRPGLRR